MLSEVCTKHLSAEPTRQHVVCSPSYTTAWPSAWHIEGFLISLCRVSEYPVTKAFVLSGADLGLVEFETYTVLSALSQKKIMNIKS